MEAIETTWLSTEFWTRRYVTFGSAQHPTIAGLSLASVCMFSYMDLNWHSTIVEVENHDSSVFLILVSSGVMPWTPCILRNCGRSHKTIIRACPRCICELTVETIVRCRGRSQGIYKYEQQMHDGSLQYRQSLVPFLSFFHSIHRQPRQAELAICAPLLPLPHWRQPPLLNS